MPVIFIDEADKSFDNQMICFWMDERLPKSAGLWSEEGVRMAVREILKSTNTLFDNVIKILRIILNSDNSQRESCWRETDGTESVIRSQRSIILAQNFCEFFPVK